MLVKLAGLPDANPLEIPPAETDDLKGSSFELDSDTGEVNCAALTSGFESALSVESWSSVLDSGIEFTEGVDEEIGVLGA